MKCCERKLILRRALRHDVHALAAFVEHHFAIHEREQRPIPAGADIMTGHKLGAALADQDAAGGDELSAKSFHAEPFADAVAAVADVALTFLMCHKIKRAEILTWRG